MNKINNNKILSDKSEDFALLIIQLYEFLNKKKKDFILSKQILKSGTSIGANIAESNGAQSDADFIAKLHISLKEGRETEYWLKLLYKANYIDAQTYKIMTGNLDEILSILVTTLKTIKSRLNS